MNNANKNRTVAKLCGSTVVLVLGQFLVGQAQAADVAMTFGAGATHTDNIDRVSEDGQDETVAEARVNLDVDVSRRNFDAVIHAALSRYDYTKDTNEDDTVGALEAELAARFLNDNVRVYLLNNYGRALFDPFAPDRPENWENVNYLSTGIDTRFMSYQRFEAGLDVEYSKLNYEIRPYDSEQIQGVLWFGREVKRNQNLAINFKSDRTEFSDTPTAPEVDRTSVYLSYAIDGAQTDINAEIGYTEQEVADFKSDGVTYDFNLIRQMGAYSDVAFGAVRQYSNDGNIFRFDQGVSREADNISDISSEGTPFLMTSFDLAYSVSTTRTTLMTRFTYRDQDYEEQSDLGREDFIVSIYGRRDFTSRVWAYAEIGYVQRDFADLDRNDKNTVGLIGIAVRLSPGFVADLSFGRTSRDSTLDTDEYEENRTFLGISYTPSWAR
jgi:hypothetical protein